MRYSNRLVPWFHGSPILHRAHIRVAADLDALGSALDASVEQETLPAGLADADRNSFGVRVVEAGLAFGRQCQPLEGSLGDVQMVGLAELARERPQIARALAAAQAVWNFWRHLNPSSDDQAARYGVRPVGGIQFQGMRRCLPSGDSPSKRGPEQSEHVEG